MFPEILKVLACPKCRHELQAHADALICSDCELAYPIENEIPVLLIEKARPVQ